VEKGRLLLKPVRFSWKLEPKMKTIDAKSQYSTDFCGIVQEYAKWQ